MKKYLKEIETSGIILLAIGVILSLIAGSRYGMWPCIVGLILWVIVVVYKAFHWAEFAVENKRNIIIMLIAIVFLIIQMMRIL